MKTTSFSELRRTLAATIDRVTDDHEPVIITRDRGRTAAVLMSIEDFASYEETQYLLRSPAKAERLNEATRDLEAGRGTERDLTEGSLSFTKLPGRTMGTGKKAHPKILKRFNDLIKDCLRMPYQGIGKPEPLRH